MVEMTKNPLKDLFKSYIIQLYH